MWCLLGKLRYDLPLTLRHCRVLDELGRHQPVLAWGKERCRRCSRLCFTVCWISQGQVSQLLLIFTCSANEALACSGTAINLCTTYFCFLQNLILPLSYHPMQAQSISTLFYEMSC